MQNLQRIPLLTASSGGISFFEFGPSCLLERSVLAPQRRAFFAARLGGSFFVKDVTKEYIPRRGSVTDEFPDLYHYPDVSRITLKRINWMEDSINSKLLKLSSFVPNTLRLQGVPAGASPEYMQERLRRFFSRFGIVNACRCIPHPLDPYQCEGTAFVSFYDAGASKKASKAYLRFPLFSSSEPIRIEHMTRGTKNDSMILTKLENHMHVVLKFTRYLYVYIALNGPLELRNISLLAKRMRLEKIKQNQEETVKQCIIRNDVHHECTDSSVEDAILALFRGWTGFFKKKPFDRLFYIADGLHGTGRSVCVNPLSPNSIDSIIEEAKSTLKEGFKKELWPYWRAGKMDLPDETISKIRQFDRKKPLPEKLQMLSRPSQLYPKEEFNLTSCRKRVFDENILFKLRQRSELLKKRNSA